MITNSLRRNSKIICLALVPVLTFGSFGCGKTEVVLSGGKPVSHWVQALQSPDARSRKKAAFELGNVGPSDPVALPALLASLEDRDPVVRREAVLALVKHGPAASEAVPRLVKLRQSDRDPRVRSYASQAIDKLGGNK